MPKMKNILLYFFRKEQISIMKKYFFVSMPKPLSFIITIVLMVIIIITIGNYIAENPIPVGGGTVNVNATLEDLAEKFYEDMNR